ncbi:MAG: chemotaxis protein CheW [Minwuia sp.]|nr:chemotaxis protein CheW [Minwuia sp.]
MNANPLSDVSPRHFGRDQSIVTASIRKQLYAFPILSIGDTIRVRSLTPAPGAQPVIPGVINLRGRIVTAICMRRFLGTPDASWEGSYGIIASYENEHYCFLFDRIGEVIPRERFEIEPVPGTIAPNCQQICTSIARIGNEIAIILDPNRVVQECFSAESETNGSGDN